MNKNQRRNKKIDKLVEELNSDTVKSGKAQNMREHAMFIHAMELDEQRKNHYIQ